MKNRKVVEIKYHDNGEKYRPSKRGYYVEICNLFQCRMEQKKNQKNKNKKAQHHRTDDSRVFCRSCAYACNSKTIEMKSKTRTFLAYLRRLAWDGNEIK